MSTPTVTVTTSGPSTYGSPVTITATLPTGTTGTVTITSGGTTLGSGTVSTDGHGDGDDEHAAGGKRYDYGELWR